MLSSKLTTPHKLRPEAGRRKATGRRVAACGRPQPDGRGRQLHAVVRRQPNDHWVLCDSTPLGVEHFLDAPVWHQPEDRDRNEKQLTNPRLQEGGHNAKEVQYG